MAVVLYKSTYWTELCGYVDASISYIGDDVGDKGNF